MSENYVPAEINPSRSETTVKFSHKDDLVWIWTTQSKVIRRLRKRPDLFAESGSGTVSGREWAAFTIPEDRFDLVGAARRRRRMSDEERGRLRERMSRLRQRLR